MDEDAMRTFGTNYLPLPPNIRYLEQRSGRNEYNYNLLCVGAAGSDDKDGGVETATGEVMKLEEKSKLKFGAGAIVAKCRVVIDSLVTPPK